MHGPRVSSDRDIYFATFKSRLRCNYSSTFQWLRENLKGGARYKLHISHTHVIDIINIRPINIFYLLFNITAHI